MSDQSLPPGKQRVLYIYVDVDETLIRNAGTKRIPIPSVIEHIKELKKQGAVLYCWSSGGADYAKASAEELNVADCFMGFLPKPNVMLDDQSFPEWRYFLKVHPSECPNYTFEKYREKLIY